MRASHVHLLLLVVSASAFAGGVLTSQPTLLLCGCIGSLLLLTSIAAARGPLPATLRSFQNQAVIVRLWGTPRSMPGGADLVVGSVSVIGAGLHVFFRAGSGRSIHLKVAQPRDATVSSEGVVIKLAKYVQWAGTTVARTEGAPAVVVSLKGSVMSNALQRMGEENGVHLISIPVTNTSLNPARSTGADPNLVDHNGVPPLWTAEDDLPRRHGGTKWVSCVPRREVKDSWLDREAR